MQAPVKKRVTCGERRRGRAMVVVVGLTVLNVALEALVGVIEENVRNAGHGIGAVCRGRAARHDFDAIDERA